MEFSNGSWRQATERAIRADAEVICPKCGYNSGDSWLQCEGRCPMSMSPHYVGDDQVGYLLEEFPEPVNPWLELEGDSDEFPF